MDQNWPEQNRFHAAFLVRKTLTASWQGTLLIGSYIQSVAVYTFQPQMCGLQAAASAVCTAHRTDWIVGGWCAIGDSTAVPSRVYQPWELTCELWPFRMRVLKSTTFSVQTLCMRNIFARISKRHCKSVLPTDLCLTCAHHVHRTGRKLRRALNRSSLSSRDIQMLTFCWQYFFILVNQLTS